MRTMLLGFPQYTPENLCVLMIMFVISLLIYFINEFIEYRRFVRNYYNGTLRFVRGKLL